MKSIILNKNISKRVEGGHPWIFSNEVNTGKEKDTNAKPGEIVDVYSFDKKFIGRGYYNPQSQISVRLLTRDKNEPINDAFFYNRIKQAWEYRQRIGYTENCRLIFGEADDMPQLII